jgi:hypothetical protein
LFYRIFFIIYFRKVTVEKSANKLVSLYPLKDGFGLLEEGVVGGTFFLSLVYLDLQQHTLTKIHTIEYPFDAVDIFVNKADPNTFLAQYHFNDEWIMQIGEIVEKTIIIGDVINIDLFPRALFPRAFYGKYVYFLHWYQCRGKNRTGVSFLDTFLVNILNVLEIGVSNIRRRTKENK